MIVPRDPVALIELGYRPRTDSDAWMRAMALPVTESVDRDGKGGVHYFQIAQASDAIVPTPSSARSSLADDVDARNLASELRAVLATGLGTAIRSPGMYGVCDTLGRVPASARERGVRDVAAIVVDGAEGTSWAFCTPSARKLTIDASTRALWRHIAIHLGAGLRLSERKASTEDPEVECVLTPGGRVMHARGEARTLAVRERLRAAVHDIDRARARRGRSDAHAALELWRGLLCGRWSVVDHFDSDGRRFLLARQNPVGVLEGARLTHRQRQVLFFAAAGWSNKQVAHALGVNEATVAAHLNRGLHALRLRSRNAWIGLAGQITARMQPPERTARALERSA